MTETIRTTNDIPHWDRKNDAHWDQEVEALDPIHVTRSSMPELDEYIQEITSIWQSRWLTNMGAKHDTFESMLRTYLQVKNVALYTNGHSALECSLEALGLRGKVITTPFSFASTTHAIVRKGLEPVFADIREDDYTLDPESIERLVDSSTCAIVPVHVYGNVCQVEAIEEIARRYNLKVIYDAAHAFGVKRDGVPVASHGDISMFSFHATKVFNTIEGGALTFGDDGLKQRLDQWKNFGITGPEDVEYIGGNAKMNEFCAAMGICNLRRLPQDIALRRTIYERYAQNLRNLEGIGLPRMQDGVEHNYSYMPVRIDEAFGASRDDVYEFLAEHRIFSRKYFYPLISDFSCYAGRFDSRRTPVAREASERVLTLPIYPDLPLETVDQICDLLWRLKLSS
ncbi:DegT/DnrJ/EryC1/StrS family aminotransferase [Actinomycetaceae bacterium L2_0104]